MNRYHYTINGKQKTLIASDEKYIARIEGTDNYTLDKVTTFAQGLVVKPKKKTDMFLYEVLRLIDKGVFKEGQKFDSNGMESEIINGVLIWSRIGKPVIDNCNEYVKFDER